MIYGYGRVSTKDQNENRQLDEFFKLGIKEKNIFIDKQSGKDFERPAYKKLLRKLKKDDLLIVKSIDRLGRNYHDILEEWKRITKELGADVRILDMPLLDTTKSKDLLGTLISDIVLQLLSFVAENERANIRQRQAEGIAAAKKRGVRFGRPECILPPNFFELRTKWEKKELSACKAAELANMNIRTFYRKIKQY